MVADDLTWQMITVLLAGALAWVIVRQRHQVRPEGLDAWKTIAEDALKILVSLKGQGARVEGRVLSTPLGLSDELTEKIITALVSFGWVERDVDEGLRLTDEGLMRAHELVRVHRLWEQYLVEHEGMSPDEVHAEAHRREHTTSSAEAAKLDAQLGYPVRDPHGHAIPDEGRRVPEAGGIPLSEAAEDGPLRIIHVDDSPPELFAQLAAMGLQPGMSIEVVTSEPQRLTLRIGDRLTPLAASAAEHIHVSPEPARPVAMGELAPGSRARVVETRGEGRHQRRMLDMGLVPGTEVTVLRTAPLGDPVEYRVKGTAISMRRSDANTVLVDEESGEDDD